jgi:hypothetical protein
MSGDPESKEAPMHPSPGDVIFSSHCLPVPDAIMHPMVGRDTESLVDFRVLQEFMGFLEYIVLTERLIVPVPRYSASTERMQNHKTLWVDFALLRLPGDFGLRIEEVSDFFTDAGVLFDAVLDIGEPTADSVVERLLPTSRVLQRHFRKLLDEYQHYGNKKRIDVAKAQLAVRIGAPLHVAEAAGIARLPYVLGPIEQLYLKPYESENARNRKSVAHILLERLNGGARKELAQLSQLGLPVSFPDTPIASMILHESVSIRDMLKVSLQLRSEFAAFRRELNQMEFELANEDQPIKKRLRQLNKLEQLSATIWPTDKKDFRRTAIDVSDAILAIPELATTPSLASLKDLTSRISAVPVDIILNAFRRRKVRLMLKAKRSFLNRKSLTPRLAAILSVPEGLILKSKSAHLRRNLRN